jgi:adenine-specific DNA-methyltransferase
MAIIKLENHLLIHSPMEAVLSKMKDSSVDLVLTDAPYGIRKDSSWDDREHFIANINLWLWECLRVSKHAVIWFCASRMLPYIMNAIRGHEEYFYRMHTYEKPAGSQFGGSSNNNIWYSIEPVLIFSKDWERTKQYGKEMPFSYDQFSYRTVAKAKFDHQTSKPVPLIRKLAGHYSALGETILDPFAGSFSTAVASIDMGRRSISIEQSPIPDIPITDCTGDNPNHFYNGVERVKAHLSAPRLFVGADEDVDTEIIENTIEMEFK